MKRICILMCVLYFTSCKEEKFPEDILQPKLMEQVFFDYLQIDIFTKDFLAKDSTKNPAVENAILQKKMFQKYGISKEAFYKSYEYYAKDEVLMKALLDSISSQQRIRTRNIHLQKTILNEKKL